MPEIKRVELERENDEGVHEVKQGERLEPVEPAPPESSQLRTEDDHKPVRDPREPQPDPSEPPRDIQRDPKDDPRHAPQQDPPHDKDEFERATTSFPGG
jgi:hypothetical protein